MTENLGEKLTDRAEMRAREILKGQDIAKIEAGHLPDCEEYMVCQTCDCAEIKLQARVAELEAALTWYGEQARLCRLIHSGGNDARHNLSDDGGKKAHKALNGA